ncbi:MAG: Holliday junction branch migration protein RuvA [Pseudomonadota bacterium]|nr:Holliday junction branch migration protein RuvA [Pseudomonadota bacterium]
MIGRIEGKLLEKRGGEILVDVQGLGYELSVPMTTLFSLPAQGHQVVLFVHLVVREDAQLLYGFSGRAERDLFRQMIKVSGVGPKVALAILSGLDAAAFRRCVEAEDTATLIRLPGIGRKTAERLLLDLRDRLDGVGSSAEAPAVTVQSDDPMREAEAALIALGYRPQEAAKAVAGASNELGESECCSEDLIRLALKRMVSA